MIELAKGGTGTVTWEPIETAPKGSPFTRIWLGGPGWVEVGFWSDYQAEWCLDNEQLVSAVYKGAPTHWQPYHVPSPPSSS